MRHRLALKLLRGETGEVALVAAPEGLAVGHGLWALVEDAVLGPADTPAGQCRLQSWEGHAACVMWPHLCVCCECLTSTSCEPLKSSAAFKTRLSQAPPVQSAPSSVLEFPQWLPLPKIHTLSQQLSPSCSATCAGFLLLWGLQASGGGPHCY